MSGTGQEPKMHESAAAEFPERAYRMIHLGPGDYLMPSNDGLTLWRIARYREDDGTYPWALWKWDGPMPTIDVLADSFEDPDPWFKWEHWGGPMRTRREAVKEALRHGR